MKKYLCHMGLLLCILLEKSCQKEGTLRKNIKRGRLHRGEGVSLEWRGSNLLHIMFLRIYSVDFLNFLHDDILPYILKSDKVRYLENGIYCLMLPPLKCQIFCLQSKFVLFTKLSFFKKS